MKVVSSEFIFRKLSIGFYTTYRFRDKKKTCTLH